MGTTAEAIHNHHADILEILSGHANRIIERQPEADPKALVAFLKDDLVPHAVGEEIHMYPAIDPLVKKYGKATATMSVDHEFIRGYIEQIDATTRALETASLQEKPALQVKLERLTLQLQAVLTLHLEKEERVYIPLMEEHMPEDEQERVLVGLHEQYEQPANA